MPRYDTGKMMPVRTEFLTTIQTSFGVKRLTANYQDLSTSTSREDTTNRKTSTDRDFDAQIGREQAVVSLLI
jgi:hypothetical protein